MIYCLNRLQQQLDSSRANDESISQPASVDRGADRDSAFPVQTFFIVGCAGGQCIIIVHEPSGPHVSVDTPAATRGSLVRSFTPSKPGDGLRVFANNASVTVVNLSSDALTTVASNS